MVTLKAVGAFLLFYFFVAGMLFVFSRHIDVEAGFQSSKSTIAETGMGVTSRP